MSGWGEGAWGKGTWGEGELVLSGVVTSGAVGTITRDVSVALTGVLCHPDVGGVNESNFPEIQEVHANGYAGITSPDREIVLSGVAADGLIGTVVQSASIDLTGNLGYGYPGGVIVPINSNQADGLVGSVLGNREIVLTGNASSASIGSVGTGARTFALMGNQAQGNAGDLIAVYWKIIDNSQTANWQNINNS